MSTHCHCRCAFSTHHTAPPGLASSHCCHRRHPRLRVWEGISLDTRPPMKSQLCLSGGCISAAVAVHFSFSRNRRSRRAAFLHHVYRQARCAHREPIAYPPSLKGQPFPTYSFFLFFFFSLRALIVVC
jgi:hypothetical protein